MMPVAVAGCCWSRSPSAVEAWPGGLGTDFAVCVCSPCSPSSPSQNWDDQDIPDLLGWMEDHLLEGIATLSSFDRYKKELLSGQLSWAPMHESGGWGLHRTAAASRRAATSVACILLQLQRLHDDVSAALVVLCAWLSPLLLATPSRRSVLARER